MAQTLFIACPPGCPRAIGRLPMPAPDGWPGALLAARRPRERACYRAYWRGGMGRSSQSAVLRWPARGTPIGPCILPMRAPRSAA
jgi:hypothetical protein